MPHNITENTHSQQGVTAPNFTQIPNVFLDYWMAHLSGGEFKVLAAISRRTFGWHKTKDKISLSQIMKATGMSRRGVIKSIALLEEKKLVICTRNQSDEHGCTANTYQILVNEHPKVSQSAQASALSAPPPRELSAPPLGNSVYQQKKPLTKEREQPPRECAEVQEKSVVVVPSFFSYIGGEAEVYEKLLKLFNVDQIEAAVGLMIVQGEEPSNLFGWLRGAIQDGWTKAPSKDERTEGNRRVLHNKFGQLDGKCRWGVTITVGPTYIEFISGGQSAPKVFKTDIPNFESSVREYIKKIQERHRGG